VSNRKTQGSTMLQGMMFLPDGRVLIMDKELYQKTLEQSIVLDLFETPSLQPQEQRLTNSHNS